MNSKSSQCYTGNNEVHSPEVVKAANVGTVKIVCALLAPETAEDVEYVELASNLLNAREATINCI